MAKQTINQGTAPTGAGGDTFRSGSAKLQANDDELYAQLGATAQGVLPAALPLNKGGTGATTAAAARTNLGLGTAATGTLTVNDEDSTRGRVLRVGDFGIASPYGTSPDSAASQRHKGCFTRLMNNSNHITEAGDYPVLATPQFLQQLAIATVTPSKNHTVQISYINTGEMYIRAAGYESDFSSWFKIFSQKNTTIDANGFIKGASPIVKLFADKIELNDEAEQQEITFEKLDIGDYLIKGSSGFALEGWYVETPKDANGNVLFSVIYKTLENGDISVKTYKKKFDFETVSIVADLDNPVDITENRWIDLRLQELPQPEIEEPESVAPPEFQPTGLTEAVAKVMESYHDPE